MADTENGPLRTFALGVAEGLGNQITLASQAGIRQLSSESVDHVRVARESLINAAFNLGTGPINPTTITQFDEGLTKYRNSLSHRNDASGWRTIDPRLAEVEFNRSIWVNFGYIRFCRRLTCMDNWVS